MRMFIRPCFEFAHFQLGEIKTRVNKTHSTVYMYSKIFPTFVPTALSCDQSCDQSLSKGVAPTYDLDLESHVQERNLATDHKAPDKMMKGPIGSHDKPPQPVKSREQQGFYLNIYVFSRFCVFVVCLLVCLQINSKSR